jgi:hypothetical protein
MKFQTRKLRKVIKTKKFIWIILVVVGIFAGVGIWKLLTVSSGVHVVDGRLAVSGQNFIVKGVCGMTVPIGKDPSSPNSPYYWWEDPSNYATDFALMREMGANTVRTYGESGISSEALDCAYNNGIYVIVGYWVNDWADLSDPSVRQTMVDEFVELVENNKDHPAVLMWAFGNEVDFSYPLHRPGDADLRDWYSLLQEAARAAKEVDPNHPILSVNQEIEEIGDASLGADDASLSAVDIWGVNSYPGSSFGALFAEYRLKSGKPLLMTEWGCDAWNGVTGAEDQDMQAGYDLTLWLEISSNLVPDGPCIGGTVFSWSDGWWKAGTPSAHTTTAQWQNYAYTDPNMNEEWWGIVALSPENDEKLPREAYYVLKDMWSSSA